MPLFRRRREEPEPPPPEWAQFFDAEEWRAFVGEVRAALDDIGIGYRLDPEGAVTFEGWSGQAGLGNLAQTCHAAERAEWPELVRNHFRQLLAAAARDPEAVDRDDALPLLKVRLWSREDIPGDLTIVARPFADDLLAALVLDLPETVSGVTREQADGWALSDDELFDRAAEQTRADPDLEVVPLEAGEGAVVTWAESASFFAASRAIWPEDLLGAAPGEHGAIVAVPNRHLVGVHAIEDMAAVEAVQAMVGFGVRRFAEGPGSISPHLYWWRPDRVERLPVEIEGESIRFFPPPEFVELLNGLAGPDR